MWDSRHLGTVTDFGSQMRSMKVEDRPQLCGTTSLGMGGFGKRGTFLHILFFYFHLVNVSFRLLH